MPHKHRNNLTDYTTYDEVRATLGVSIEEITDETLALSIWSSSLDFALEDFSDTLVPAYDDIALKLEEDRTADECKVYNLTRLYATYLVAEDLLKSLPMFSFKRLTDGKAGTERFDAWKDTKAGVQAGLAAIKLRLELTLGKVADYTPPVRSGYRFVSSTGLAVNPITS